MDLHQFGALQDPADVGDGEQGLDAAGAAADDADGAGGGDGGDGGVAHAAQAVALVAAAGEGGKVAPLVREPGGGQPGLLLDEGHDLFGHRHRLLGVVADAHLQEEVGKAHDPQADLPGLQGALFDLGEREVVGVDDVVQEVDRVVHQVARAG